MDNLDKPLRFRDYNFKCKKCHKFLGKVCSDSQILIINNVAIFNFARFACMFCEAVNNFESPNLIGELLSDLPDKLSDFPPDKIIKNLSSIR